jgi:hypothetical protein
VLPNTDCKISPLILDNVQLSENLSIKKINGLLTVLPSRFRLYQNYPNPFNPETWIPYQLASDANVTISIYNIKGEKIRTLHIGYQRAGSYMTQKQAAYWDGRDDEGSKVASAIHFYTIQAGNYTATKKMVIAK